ncbi:hypothetical protein PHLGIDRAFT_180012 [Phlebiopsis gigantea 11061_1 CR5-6]|uniref:Uncharacterized protein n=1 Tax=Phlebiopsis gigantea (strain 11061_1 CR5-6) TaxID=745531 RepID=A0A0C3PGE0_PHLG1|nr:hypothetical protein PHLGIDRAFT_180012 [Phlebiopsis gigantea 11061_1 CR5-6]
MADNANLFDPTVAHAADTEFFVRRGMTKGYELLSLLAPPAYAAFAITRYGRSHVSLNRLLRATWVGGGVGVAGGGAFEYVRSAYSSPDNVRNRRLVVTYDTASIRADDHSTIGGILFAVLTPAVFWKHAGKINLILGGAGVGSAVGFVVHHSRSLFGDPPPSAQIPGLKSMP